MLFLKQKKVAVTKAGERNENEVDDEFCPFRSTVRIEMEEDCMRTACGPLVADELTALPVGHVASFAVVGPTRCNGFHVKSFHWPLSICNHSMH